GVTDRGGHDPRANVDVRQGYAGVSGVDIEKAGVITLEYNVARRCQHTAALHRATGHGAAPEDGLCDRIVCFQEIPVVDGYPRRAALLGRDHTVVESSLVRAVATGAIVVRERFGSEDKGELDRGDVDHLMPGVIGHRVPAVRARFARIDQLRLARIVPLSGHL